MKQGLIKKAAPFLEPGEVVTATCIGQQLGVFTGQAVGGLIGAAVASKAKKADRGESEASGFPMAANMTIAVTDRRIIVYYGKKLIGAVPRDQIAGAEVEKKSALMPWKVAVKLRNGYTARMTVNRFTGPAEFVAAVQALANTPAS